MNSLVLVPNFPNWKSYLGQILWHLHANKSLQLLPLVVENKSKTEHLRYGAPIRVHPVELEVFQVSFPDPKTFNLPM